ncbi:hypothetical protein OQA88_1434 [Cercophora sp. LCS_1]
MSLQLHVESDAESETNVSANLVTSDARRHQHASSWVYNVTGRVFGSSWADPPPSQALTVIPTVPPIWSANYRGDQSRVSNIPADVQAGENISFWIRGLPETVTHSEILDRIRQTGRVYHLVINGPTDEHHTAAARLTFFSRQAAVTFADATMRGFWVRGYRTQVREDRIGVLERVYGSRVIVITGPIHLVNWASLRALLVPPRLRFYHLDRVLPLRETRHPDLVELEVHFASFRAQAEAASVIVRREWRPLGVTVRFGDDPCGNS